MNDILIVCGLLCLVYFRDRATASLHHFSFRTLISITVLMESAAGAESNGEHEIIGWFEDVSENTGYVQTQTLCRILELNSGVEYLKKWLGDINVQEMEASALESLYTSLVPLASHADLETYIQRIADGDTSPILTNQPITTLSLRSVSYLCVIPFFPLLALHFYYLKPAFF